MALARAASGHGGQPLSATSDTWAFDVGSGANRVLYVGVFDGSGGSSLISGITFNGVALTKIGGAQVSGDLWATLWYLINPASGSHDIVVTASSACPIYNFAACYTGASQSSQPDSSNTGTVPAATADHITIATTVVAANSWLVGFTRESGGVGQTYSVGAEVDGGGGGHFFDSNGAVGTGSQPITITTTLGFPSYACVLASIAEASSGSTPAPPAGSLVLTGNTPTRLQTHSQAPAAGSLALTGQLPVAIEGVNRTASPPAGVLTFTGEIPAVNNGTIISPPAGALVFTGENVTVAFLGPDTGAITFTGLTPVMVFAGNPLKTPDAGTMTFTGLAPTVNTPSGQRGVRGRGRDRAR